MNLELIQATIKPHKLLPAQLRAQRWVGVVMKGKAGEAKTRFVITKRHRNVD